MRRRLELVAVAAFCLPAMLHAGPRDPGDERARKDLAALERAWIDAEADHDAATLQRILDDRFVCTFLTSKPLDKSTFISAQMRPGPKATQELSDETMVVNGDTAVVVNTDTLHSVRNGTPFAETARITATYIRRGGHWRALAEHMAWETKPSPQKP